MTNSTAIAGRNQSTRQKIVMPEMFYPASMHFKQLESGFRPKPCRNDKFSDFCKSLKYHVKSSLTYLGV